jgi:hypothetical protein
VKIVSNGNGAMVLLFNAAFTRGPLRVFDHIYLGNSLIIGQCAPTINDCVALEFALMFNRRTSCIPRTSAFESESLHLLENLHSAGEGILTIVCVKEQGSISLKAYIIHFTGFRYTRSINNLKRVCRLR